MEKNKKMENFKTHEEMLKRKKEMKKRKIRKKI